MVISIIEQSIGGHRDIRHADAEFSWSWLLSWTKVRKMEFINRYIDQPLLHGASRSLFIWHVRTGQSPAKLEPLWNLVVTVVLLSASAQILTGSAFLLGAGALLMLSLPSMWKLWSVRGRQVYNARAYRALAAVAVRKREAEWSVRLIILLIALGLPVLVTAGDPTTGWFLLGASLWFVLTAPVRTYLEAAEPPPPGDGERSVRAHDASMLG
jgi:hypothetical protein